jgi:Uma2 family endonuclease
MISSIQDLDLTKTYSYADYLAWQFSERIELLQGYVRQMAAPSTKHQRTAVKLTTQLENYFEIQQCNVFIAPFDVRLYNRKKSILAEKDIFTVVQPDICVICDQNKLDEKGCNGSPDLIIEILSPSNKHTDLIDKYQLYAETGVLEYWIVYPEEEVIHQYVLENENYKSQGVYVKPYSIISFLFPELKISLDKVFV